ncbi:MAG: hypothetical protein V3T17_05325 [Pseudomonadales bacterium]
MGSLALRLVQPDEFVNHDLVVSFDGEAPLSKFSDNKWDLSPYVENKNCKRSDKEINFKLTLDDGRCLTDSTYSLLLRSVKGFLYARMTRPHPRTGKAVKPRTAVGIWFRLRPLLRWMINKGVCNFTSLTPVLAQEYRKHIEGLGMKPNTLLKRLSIIEMLFQYSAFFPMPVKGHPWPDESSVSISGDRKSTSTQTLEIPPQVYAKLGNIALKCVEEQSDDAVYAHEKCCDILRNFRDEAIYRLESGKTKPVGLDREFQIEYCSTRAKRPRLDDAAREAGFPTYGKLNEAIHEFHTACYIVCALFSGMRDSELSSLETGAFFTKTGLDGIPISWLKGTTYKLEDMPMPAEWMVPQCVGQAVTVLTRITKFHRECLSYQINNLKEGDVDHKNTRLNELKGWQNCLFLVKGNRGYTYRAMENSTINHRLRQFIKKHRITDVNGKLWPIATHQFRRTFAVFVAKNMMGDLRYLRHHFKHWSMDMTLHYARHKRGDDSLISDILSERDKLNRIIVSDWLSGNAPLAGGRGQAIINFKSRNKIKTAGSLKEAVGNLADGLFIRATGHSWCMSNGDNCGGQGLYDSLHCVSCNSAVIDKSLLPAWNGIKQQQQEILQLDDVGISVIHSAQKQIEAADSIIQVLSDEH